MYPDILNQSPYLYRLKQRQLPPYIIRNFAKTSFATVALAVRLINTATSAI